MYLKWIIFFSPEASAAPTPSSLLADPLALRSFSNTVLNRAFMELLQWPQETLVPEVGCWGGLLNSMINNWKQSSYVIN